MKEIEKIARYQLDYNKYVETYKARMKEPDNSLARFEYYSLPWKFWVGFNKTSKPEPASKNAAYDAGRYCALLNADCSSLQSELENEK